MPEQLTTPSPERLKAAGGSTAENSNWIFQFRLILPPLFISRPGMLKVCLRAAGLPAPQKASAWWRCRIVPPFSRSAPDSIDLCLNIPLRSRGQSLSGCTARYGSIYRRTSAETSIATVKRKALNRTHTAMVKQHAGHPAASRRSAATSAGHILLAGTVQKAIKIIPGPGFGAVRPDKPKAPHSIVVFHRRFSLGIF